MEQVWADDQALSLHQQHRINGFSPSIDRTHCRLPKNQKPSNHIAQDIDSPRGAGRSRRRGRRRPGSQLTANIQLMRNPHKSPKIRRYRGRSPFELARMQLPVLLCAMATVCCALPGLPFATDEQDRKWGSAVQPLPEGWLSEHRGEVHAELASHTFGFIVGAPHSGRLSACRERVVDCIAASLSCRVDVRAVTFRFER